MSEALVTRPLADGRVAHLRFGSKADGDLAVTGDPLLLEERRHSIVSKPWSWLTQIHGADFVVVTDPGEGAGLEADALVTGTSDAALAIHTADCAPVGFIGANSHIAVAHAGWRGLTAGVLENTIKALRDLGETDVTAYLGPCIHPECYEFGANELRELAADYGDAVVGETSSGTPALDVPVLVAAILRKERIALDTSMSSCTGCQTEWFSFRSNKDTGRQATVAWIEDK